MLLMLAAPLIAMGAPIDLAERATSGTRASACWCGRCGPAVADVDRPSGDGFPPLRRAGPGGASDRHLQHVLTNDVFHDNEHLAFLVIGYLFWRPVVAIEPSRHPLSPPLRLVYLMLAVPIDTFSGLVLMSANHEMFPAYLSAHRTWGPSLLGDLHIGGAIMWVAGDTLMVLAMIPVAVSWLRSEDQVDSSGSMRSWMPRGSEQSIGSGPMTVVRRLLAALGSRSWSAPGRLRQSSECPCAAGVDRPEPGRGARWCRRRRWSSTSASPSRSTSAHCGSSVRGTAGRQRRHPSSGPGQPCGCRLAPKHLADGTYVVAWRVISADSHPVHGAFVFSVGSAKGAARPTALATSIADQSGSAVVGGVYWLIRMLGVRGTPVPRRPRRAGPFLWKAGGRSRRVARILWGSWGILLAATPGGDPGARDLRVIAPAHGHRATVSHRRGPPDPVRRGRIAPARAARGHGPRAARDPGRLDPDRGAAGAGSARAQASSAWLCWRRPDWRGTHLPVRTRSWDWLSISSTWRRPRRGSADWPCSPRSSSRRLRGPTDPLTRGG